MSLAQQIYVQLQNGGYAKSGLCADSRSIKSGEIFVALTSKRTSNTVEKTTDVRLHIAEAVARGASFVLYEAGAVGEITVPHRAVVGLDEVIGEIANLIYGEPSQALWTCAVTGTNGKTSVAYWIAQAMHHHAQQHRNQATYQVTEPHALQGSCGFIGTLGIGFPAEKLHAESNTTPNAVVLQRALAQFVQAGASACAMEASSIGLAQNRLDGVALDCAVFTNCTRDHLDYHGTMQAYGRAKEALFLRPELKHAVINLDDALGCTIIRHLSSKGAGPKLIAYSTIPATKMQRDEVMHDLGLTDEILTASDIHLDADQGTALTFSVAGVPFHVHVIGDFNLANLLAVIAVLRTYGMNLPEISQALSVITAPPGRLQACGGNGRPLVIIDFAHTPDALEKVLGTLRRTATNRRGKLFCLFGCGGERDIGKRPLMGAIAVRLADQVILTSDNPRSEEPLKIIKDIQRGIPQPAGNLATEPHACIVMPERLLAVASAIKRAQPQDVVLLAGKGAESYIEAAGVRYPYSDLAAAQKALGEYV